MKISRFVLGLAGLSLGMLAPGQELPRGLSVAPSAAARRGPKGQDAHSPSNYGVAHRVNVRHGVYDFTPADSSGGWQAGPGATRYPKDSSWPMVCPVHLPGGSILTYLEFDFCDTSPTDHMELDLLECENEGQGCMSILPAPLISSNSECAFVSYDDTLSHVINNYTHIYFLRATWGALDGTNSLAAAIVGYRLQVSPAANIPTFNDVPITDPGFQFIEALVGSGITAGCGGGNYCPDSPLTRRQMAVFLSKALGLFWGNY